MIETIMIFTFVAVLCFLTGHVARTKNRDPWPWGLSAIIGGIVPIIILACMKPLGAVATVKDPVETIPEYTGPIEQISGPPCIPKLKKDDHIEGDLDIMVMVFIAWFFVMLILGAGLPALISLF